jgi:hypothetical protein
VWRADSFAAQLLHLRDEKAAGTSGGTFTAGSWLTRDLNTVVTNEIAGAGLAANQITLPVGTYYIEASAPARTVNTHQAKLRNVTNSTDDLIGMSETAGTAAAIQSRSFVFGRLSVTGSSKTFELQHRCQTTRTIDGLGNAANHGLTEIHSDVRIWKVG